MQTESIVYLLHHDNVARQRAISVVESIPLAWKALQTVEEFLDAYDDSRDSCLITDVTIDGYAGVDLLLALEDQAISIPTIFVTAHAELAMAIEVMRLGAVTLLELPVDVDQLRAAIEEALTRDAVARRASLRRHAVQARINSLTKKEHEVMELVVQGTPNKTIAMRLGVSIRTIESRRQAVFQKMQVESLAELVRSVVEAEST
jgi:two-component system response regulator FixJ